MAVTRHLVVMGVSGAGKSTIAERLACSLGLEWAEGDDLHPAANVEKMASGRPLTYEDRWPWLEALAEWTREQRSKGKSTVLTCSALRKVYRDVLRTADPDTFFIHLYGDEELLRKRIEMREHFMPASLLRSQFEILEPLQPDESGVALDVAQSVEEIVDKATSAVNSARA